MYENSDSVSSISMSGKQHCVKLAMEIPMLKEQSISPFLTSGQCAMRYKISERHFRQLVDIGEMPKPLKFGRSSRWSIQTLEEFESKKIQKLVKRSVSSATSLRNKK
jgi:predicted DNA-binding transcriptional regulator AlpA